MNVENIMLNSIAKWIESIFEFEPSELEYLGYVCSGYTWKVNPKSNIYFSEDFKGDMALVRDWDCIILNHEDGLQLDVYRDGNYYAGIINF